MIHDRPFQPAPCAESEAIPIQRDAAAPPARRLLDEDAMRAAVAALCVLDPTHMPALVDRVGPPALRLRPPGFAGLAAIVTAQQVSTASAAAIFGRLEAALRPLDADALLAAPPERLRDCGLSLAKIRTLQALATAVVGGTLDLSRLADMPAAEARARLIAVQGIGPWTADVFLLFCLGHADAWPVGDLALQEAVRLIMGLERRPLMSEMERIGERWNPHRGAAAYLLWAYYRLAFKTPA